MMSPFQHLLNLIIKNIILIINIYIYIFFSTSFKKNIIEDKKMISSFILITI